MSLAENAFFFFASVIVAIFIGIVGNWFVTEYLHYRNRVHFESGQERPLNDIRNSWLTALGALMLILLFYVFLLLIASYLMQIESISLTDSPNITLNTINNYYNISPGAVKTCHPCNCDIIHLLNPNYQSSIGIFNRN